MDPISNPDIHSQEEEIKFELTELKRTTSSLKAQLEEKESEAVLAAKLGQQLLEENTKITEVYKEERDKYTTRIEELIQENYDLKSKVTLNVNLMASHTQEIQIIAEQEKKKYENEKKHLESVYEKKLNDTKRAKEALESDISQFALREKQLEENVLVLHETIQEMKKEPTTSDLNVTLEGDIYSLKKALEELTEKITVLEEKNVNLNNEIERHVLQKENIKKAFATLKIEHEHDQSQGTMWFNHLQQARTEIAEINIRLSLAEAELNGRSHSKKGNSLFSEVEDKRLEAEKKLNSLTERYKSLNSAYEISKQETHRMKTQVLALLQLRSGKADSTKMRNLEESLSQARGDIRTLSIKLKKFEDMEAKSDPLRHVKEYLQAFPGPEAQKDFVEFLLKQTEKFKESSISLKKELETARFVQIAEAHKLRETEDNLYFSTEKADKLINENLKLRLKIEELNIKVELEIRRRKESQSKSESEFLESVKPGKMEMKRPLPPTLLRNDAKKLAATQSKYNSDQSKCNSDQSTRKETLTTQKRPELNEDLRILSSDSPRTKRIKCLSRLPKELADKYLKGDTLREKVPEKDITTEEKDTVPSKALKGRKTEKKVSFKSSPVKEIVSEESPSDEVFEDSVGEQDSRNGNASSTKSSKCKVVTEDDQTAFSECKQQ